jgi:hypothetical protein
VCVWIFFPFSGDEVCAMAHSLWTTAAVGFCNGNAAISSGSVVASHRNAAISFGNRELEVGVMMCGGSSGATVAWKRQQQQQQQQLSKKKKKKGKDGGGFKRRMMEEEDVLVVVSALAGREEGAGGVVLESSEALEALKGLELERSSSSSSSSSSNGKKKNGHAVEEIESVTERKRRSFEIDTVTEKEMKENGFRSTRRTKLIATVGPACCKFEQLEELASAGMNVARLNMCHGTRDWHRDVIRNCRRLNAEKGYAVAVMMDTEGSEIHMGDLGGVSSAKAEVPTCFSQDCLHHPWPLLAQCEVQHMCCTTLLINLEAKTVSACCIHGLTHSNVTYILSS